MNSLKQRSFKFKWWAGIGLIFFGVLPLAFYVGVALPVRETRAVVHAYNSLELGTPSESLPHHFPRAPDLICEFDQSQVLYYHADARAHFIPNFGDNQK